MFFHKNSFIFKKLLTLLLSNFSPRARPEPVEGYLRALEEILQQVQDERKR